MFPTDVVIVAGARTPMTRCSGAFKDVSAIDLCAHAAKEARSEERRVGKECRSRWSPYH